MSKDHPIDGDTDSQVFAFRQGLVARGFPEKRSSKIVSCICVEGGCWKWTGTVNNRGYGYVARGGVMISLHRLSYEIVRGKIEDGKCLDHLCRNRRCVNPQHLEQVTNKVNILRGESFSAVNARKTHCIYGHPLSGDNLGIKPSGFRVCKQCARVHRRKYKQSHKKRAI